MVMANITLHGSVYPCGPAQNKNYDEAKCVKRHVGTQEAKEPFKLTETRTEKPRKIKSERRNARNQNS